jgi:outer membrane protein TolC
MKIRSVISTALFMVIVSAIVQAQPDVGPMKFSLDEAKQYALDHSPVLINSSRDIDIAKMKVWETTAIGLPQVTLDGTYSYNPQLTGFSEAIKNLPGYENVDPNDFKTNFFATITVSQLIFSGQYIVGLKASKVYKNLSELANSKSVVGIVESITTTYYTALIAKESKSILDSSLITLEKTLYQTDQLFQNGLAEQTDVDQVKILVSNIKTTASVSERQIELMERLLKFQMGIPIDQTIILTDEIDPLVMKSDLFTATIDSFNIENNIDFQLAETQEKLMKLNYQAQNALYLPSLAGFYQRYKDLDKNDFNDQSPDMFGLSLSFPLFSSGQRLSQSKQKHVDYLKAKTEKEMAAENLTIQYETSLSEFLSARDMYAMQKESRDLGLRIYKKSLIKFTSGAGASLDLIQTQSQYFEAEGKYYNALMSLVSAKSKLESLLNNASYSN